MSFSTADISVHLQMHTTNTPQEIQSQMTPCPFGAVHNPEQALDVWRLLQARLDVLVRTNPDGVI
jgi:hypothetical protein